MLAATSSFYHKQIVKLNKSQNETKWKHFLSSTLFNEANIYSLKKMSFSQFTALALTLLLAWLRSTSRGR